MIQPIDLIGFAPDVETNIRPTQGAAQGNWVDCDGFYPTPGGAFRRMPSLQPAYPALPTRVSPADLGHCYGAYTARFLDGTTRLLFATKTAIYSAASGAYTLFNTFGDYNTPAFGRWRWAMFGNDLIAVNGHDVPQILVNTGSSFAALAGVPPTAKIVATVDAGGSAGFVFLLNLSSTVPGNALTPSMWWNCAIGNDASWTPDIATQCANGYLDETPGEIVGAHANGRNLVVYKERATYLFQYVGGTTVWATNLISTKGGALSHEAVIDLGDVHLTMGFDGFYVVDSGGAPQKIEDCPCRDFIFKTDLNRNFSFAVWGRYDWSTGVAFWHYPSNEVNDAGTDPQVCDHWVAWHRQSNKWAFGRTNVEAVVLPEIASSPGITYGEFGSLYATWGTADDVPWTSIVFAGSSDVVQAIVKDDHIPYTLDGDPDAGGYFTLATYGDGQNYYFMRRARPRFVEFPANDGTYLEMYERENTGDTEAIDSTTYLDADNGFFDLIANARFFDIKVIFPAGAAEIMSLELDLDQAGSR